MRTIRTTFLCLCTAALLNFAALAQEPPGPAPDRRTALMAERKKLTAEAHEQHRRSEFIEGLKTLDLLLATDRELFGEEHTEVANTLEWMSRLEDARGEVRASIRLLEEAQGIRRRVLGENNLYYSLGQYNLAVYRAKLGEYQKAEGICLEQIEKFRTVKQRESPFYANAATILAGIYESLGEFEKAEGMYLNTQRIMSRWFGEENLRYATLLNNLAVLKQRKGDDAAAEPILRRAAEIHGRIAGKDNPEYATLLANLARLYAVLFDYVRAEALHREALEIFEKTCGEESLGTALALNNFSVFCGQTGDLDRAEALCRRALEIRRKKLGSSRPLTASSMQNLASILESKGEIQEAEDLLDSALAALEESVGVDHPDYAVTLNALAGLYRTKGEFERSERIYKRALAIQEAVVGPDAPDTAIVLHNLACLYDEMQRDDEAEPLVRRALGIRRRTLDLVSSVQSEPQQIQASLSFRRTLDLYLFLTKSLDLPVERAYAHVLAWKGSVYARQSRARLGIGNPEVAELLSEYESASRRLATLSLSKPQPAQRAAVLEQISLLAERRGLLERELAEKSKAADPARPSGRVSPKALQEALPEGTVLVDYLEFAQREKRFVAFVIRPKGPILWESLGPSAPIVAAVTEWRRRLLSGGSLHEPGEKLRKLVWEPIADHLGDADAVLVSPDGALNRIPFSALPGSSPGSYLIEERPVAVLPVPQLLPAILERHASPAENPRLLLVGDVDYGGTGPVRFGPLPAARDEASAIRLSFERSHERGAVDLLEGEAATEAAVRARAPGCRWLHLATHGFFAPPEIRSALSQTVEGRAVHPGLLSGLALAGANEPPEPDGDDGILTALEVAALDLSGVDLAVLSACETGLGEVAGGEGVLGLQRAFQVSGARTTITSLWRVPDRATRLLMERFYENLWGDRGMPKLEALREAQVHLLNSAAGDEEVLRGLGLSRDRGTSDGAGRLAPRYWAAFVLAGDWR